ncbi:hypothetical protein ACFLXY_02180 [Chloroflexota bacterium]
MKPDEPIRWKEGYIIPHGSGQEKGITIDLVNEINGGYNGLET